MKKRLSTLSILIILIFQSAYSFKESTYTVTLLNNPAPGYIFVDPMPNSNSVSFLDNTGKEAYEIVNDSFSELINLQVLSNGSLAAFNNFLLQLNIFNQNLEVVDSFSLSSPMITDFHDYLLLSNGNYLLIGSDEITVDMSAIVDGGNNHAAIKDCSLIEIDPGRNIIFQWRASDHFEITDATEDVDLTQYSIDPFHLNSVDEDSDGNLIISCRHMDEVAKINRQTGAIIWRLGGTKSRNNQFTFTNDTYRNFTGFSHQHDAQILSNGHLILFDNGNLKPTQFSRAVEYDINDVNMTVSKVWEYRKTPDYYVEAMGNVQRLPNGNTFIGWSRNTLDNSHVVATEVTSDGTPVFEIMNPSKTSYRVTKFVFKMDVVSHFISTAGQYAFNDSKYNTGINLNIQSLTGSSEVSVEKHGYMPFNKTFTADTPCITLPFRWVINQRGISNMGGKIRISIDALGDIIHPDWLQIYSRSAENNGNFTALETVFKEDSGQLEANLSSFGEFIVGFKEYFTPKLELPDNNAYGVPVNQVLKWQRIAVDARYNLQVSLYPDFSTCIIDASNLDTNQYSLVNLEHFTNYYWRVKSNTSIGSSSWSNPFVFQTNVDKPSLVSPNNLQKGIQTKSSLNWTNVDGATNYRIQIADNPEFNLPKIDATIANDNNYNFKDLDNYTNYYWRVSASNRDVSGLWSDKRQFKTILLTPTLIYPIGKSIGVPISSVFKWGNAHGAVFYNLQVSTDSAFQNIILNETGISNNQFNYKDLNYLTGYYWHIKAVCDDSKSEWSDTEYFTTLLSPTALIIPKNNAANIATKAVYSWEIIQGATEYLLEIAEDSLFKVIHHSKRLAGNAYTCNDLKYSTQYYWRVKTIQQGIDGDWSEVRKFITINQNAVTWPDLSAPADKSNNIHVSTDFAWETAPNAATYNIEIAKDDKFSVKTFSKASITLTKATISNLEYNQKYYWHVQSCKNSVCSQWSDCWSFTTLLASSKLIFPEDKQTDVKLNTVLQWEPVDGSLFFMLEIATDIEFHDIIEEKDNITGITYSPEILEQQITYYWRIKARNASNTGNWSEVSSFTTGKIASVQESEEIRRIYPNPASDYVSLENMNYSTLKIFDSMGNLVLSLTETTNRLNISNLSNGIYSLRTFSGNSSHAYKMIVIR